jgi:hypothetical protein
MYNVQEVANKVGDSLGLAIDQTINPAEISDPALAALWENAQVAMNEIQMYLEVNADYGI